MSKSAPSRMKEDDLVAELLEYGYTHDDLMKVKRPRLAKLVAENERIQELIAEALENGIYVTACKACADQLGVSEVLEAHGIDVQYLGIALTNVLKNGEKLITI